MGLLLQLLIENRCRNKTLTLIRSPSTLARSLKQTLLRAYSNVSHFVLENAFVFIFSSTSSFYRGVSFPTLTISGTLLLPCGEFQTFMSAVFHDSADEHQSEAAPWYENENVIHNLLSPHFWNCKRRSFWTVKRDVIVEIRRVVHSLY